jgi:protein involved in polysaccharide export with SLBB domain
MVSTTVHQPTRNVSSNAAPARHGEGATKIFCGNARFGHLLLAEHLPATPDFYAPPEERPFSGVNEEEMKILTIATLLVSGLAVTTAAQINKSAEKVTSNDPSLAQQAPTAVRKVAGSGIVVASAHATGAGNASPGNASQVYRVGVRDVLDIQLADNPNLNSTLFTVLEGGLLDYPFAGDPVVVAGLTTPEIAALLRRRIKVFDHPTVVVKVRDFASHTVNVSGFVAAPGVKTLRREAVPLYTVLAESLVLPEAARATIIRQGRAPFVVDLKDPDVSATLIVAGDTIKVAGMSGTPADFFFTGGEVRSPGQKLFNQGLTLTQAILASGGTSAGAGNIVRISRQGNDGRLITVEYNLRAIQAGRVADPILQKGDRITVTRTN